MGELEDRYQRWVEITGSDKWKDDINFRAEQLLGLGYLKGQLDELSLQRFIKRATDTSDVGADRVRWILQLSTFEEVLAALHATGLQKSSPVDDLFPTDGWIGSYMRHTAGNEVPTRWNFWCGLSVLGASLRRNLFLDSATFKIWPNLYIIIVEEAASRKSTAIGFGKDIIRRLNLLLRSRREYSGEHELIPIAPDSGTFVRFTEIIQSRQIVVRDEFGQDQLRLNDCTAYFAADDLVTLLSKSSFNPAAWIEGLTHLWDYSGDWDRSTVASVTRNEGKSVILRNPSLTFVGGTTLEWIRHSVTPEMIGGGFMSRCIYIVHPGVASDRFAWPTPLDPVTAMQLAEQLVGFATMPRRGVGVTPGYRKWYEDWYLAYCAGLEERIPDEKLRAYYSRRPIMLHKIAMLLMASRGSWEISPDDGQLADAILAREEEKLDLNFVKVGAHKDYLMSDRIIQYLDRKGGRLHHSELFRAFASRVGSAKAFGELMLGLTEQGRVHTKRLGGHGGGREYVLPSHYLPNK